MRYLPFVISIVAASLWVAGFSAFGKLLGLPSPPKFQQRLGGLRRLSLTQYACLYGALGWGIGMFVANLVSSYLQGKLSNNFSGFAVGIGVDLVGWLAAGCLFGWMMWGMFYRKQA